MPESTAAPNVLDAIVAAARRIVEVRQRSTPMSVMERQAMANDAPGRRLEQALSGASAPRVIAECKRRSPSRGVLRARYDPAEIAAAYEWAGAAAVSVLTEPTFFDGSPSHLQAVRATVRVPVLRKDFIVDGYQLFEARAWGADAVLLIVGALSDAELRALIARSTALGLDALVEVHDRTELDRALDAGARIVGVNNRDLRTLDVAVDLSHELAEEIPDEMLAVAESGLRTRADLDRLSSAGYDAFLVGERLMGAADPGAALKELLSCPSA